MIDITTFDVGMLRQLFMNELRNGGTTAAADNVPPLFRAGCGYDTESTTASHKDIDHYKRNGEPVYKTVIDYCFCYSYQFAIGDCYAIYRTKAQFFTALRTLLDTVKEYNEMYDTNAVLTIWCANLAHEWAFIKHDLDRCFDITKVFSKGARDVLLIQLSECVEFREAIGLFGRSLADISKNWCKNSVKLTGTFDYDLIRHSNTELTETEKAYMRNDVLSLTEMHANAVEYYTQKNGACRLPYTSSGFVSMKLKEAIRESEELTDKRENCDAFQDVKTNIEMIKRENKRAIASEYQWNLCRNYSYAGGLCGSNIDYVGKILHDVVCADVTSDYPSQMVQKKFPSGRLRRVPAQAYFDVKESGKPFFALLKIKSMCSKSHHAILSKHKIINYDNKTPFYQFYGAPKNLIVYNGKVKRGNNIIVIWNDVDINAYNEIYDIKGGCLDLWVFDSYRAAPDWLTATMCTDYINKALLKADGKQNTIEYAESKRNVNTYYGVLATRDNDINDALDIDLNFTNSKTKTFKEKVRDFWLNPYIAFWVTSYARALLMHFIARYPDAIVQYDTDSLYYIKSKGKELEKALLEYNADIEAKNKRIFKDNPNAPIFYSLGTWDFDDVYKRFLPLGAKKYIKEDSEGIHTVIAGLPKTAIPKEIESRGITEPLTYYNPIVRHIEGLTADIIIKHAFAGKFASVYDDRDTTEYIEITDHNGVKAMQETGSYHAITPIDFTLSIGENYLKSILHIR